MHSGQRDLFKKKLKSALHYNKTVNELNEINKKDWATITRQILIIAKRNKETKRIDMFLTNYGLYRGLAASLVVLAASVFLKYQTLYLWVVGLLLLAAILSLYRMHRFSEHYAKELFMEFLEQKED